MEGHIYSCFAQNSKGNPDHEFAFPYIVLLVSGGHTELVLFKDHHDYEIIGETRDDAVGEALDKAARLIIDDKVYPGGPLIERLALKGNPKYIQFTRPMEKADNCDFSYSGLKTALLYQIKEMTDSERKKHIHDLAASFQEAAFDSLLIKLEKAMNKYSISNIAVGGGVAANANLRAKIRELISRRNGSVSFPSYKTLYGDNAAMIGIAAHYRVLSAKDNEDKGFVKNFEEFDRNARARLGEI